MTTTRIRRCGEAALLLECADLAEAVTLAEEVQRSLPEAVDVVAGARTVLVTAPHADALPALRRRLESLLSPPRNPQTGVADAGGGSGVAAGGRPEIVIDVRYDGPELPAIADLAGMSVEALVRRHTSITWRAAFGGFAPGFFYLVDARELADTPGPTPGIEPLPAVPRLGSPRTRVPAGSVGLADRFCAVYPGASPGGWQLIGSTTARLWDSDRPEPALLAPGMTIRFRERR